MKKSYTNNKIKPRTLTRPQIKRKALLRTMMMVSSASQARMRIMMAINSNLMTIKAANLRSQSIKQMKLDLEETKRLLICKVSSTKTNVSTTPEPAEKIKTLTKGETCQVRFKEQTTVAVSWVALATPATCSTWVHTCPQLTIIVNTNTTM
jgi:hypothetical protein